MKLLLKILILGVILPYQLLAMQEKPKPSAPPLHSLVHSPYISSSSSSSSSSSGVYPEYPAPYVGPSFKEVAQPVRINRFTNPLRAETVAHVEKCSRGSAFIGALFGGCATGSYVQRYYTNLSPIEKVGITTAGSALSGLASYFATQWFVIRRTAEKQDENAINEIIDLNNAAFAAKYALDAVKREQFNVLLQEEVNSPKNRVYVYDYVLDIAPVNQTKKREYPIGDAVEYLDGTADAIKREGEAISNMKTKRPSDNKTISDADWEEMLKDVNQTYEAMRGLNSILPAQRITNWTRTVKELPEYKYQTAQEALREKHKDLKRREDDIRYYLARLAALHGAWYSQVCLSKKMTEAAWHGMTEAAWHGLMANYPDTPEGNRAREKDITNLGKDISSAIKAYLRECLAYDKIVTEHNKQVHRIPDAIKDFVQTYKKIDELDVYSANEQLLEFDEHVNLNDARSAKALLNSFFGRNLWSRY